MAGSETATQRQILAALSALPECLVWRNETGLVAWPNAPHKRFRIGTPGSPDIVGVYKGRAIGVEVKSARGRQSRQQCRFKQQWEKAGGVYVIARSVDDALQGIGADHEPSF